MLSQLCSTKTPHLLARHPCSPAEGSVAACPLCSSGPCLITSLTYLLPAGPPRSHCAACWAPAVHTSPRRAGPHLQAPPPCRLARTPLEGCPCSLSVWVWPPPGEAWLHPQAPAQLPQRWRCRMEGPAWKPTPQARCSRWCRTGSCTRRRAGRARWPGLQRHPETSAPRRRCTRTPAGCPCMGRREGLALQHGLCRPGSGDGWSCDKQL